MNHTLHITWKPANHTTLMKRVDHSPAPPDPSGNGIVPVINTTMWLAVSASSTEITNLVSSSCWKSDFTFRKRLH